MIKYKLKCKNCEKSFDSWFSSSKEFEKLRSKKFLSCHFCNSKKIIKTLMAPNIMTANQKLENNLKMKKNDKIKKKILEFQNFIEKNFENVGDDFAYKARSLHYDNKKNKKGIYGNASQNQIKELKEEGIETQIFPWIKDKNN
tara:strand:- start:6800 stop:7228 length:429 start_codon:yes stop_codon:yes gene_type:complete